MWSRSLLAAFFVALAWLAFREITEGLIIVTVETSKTKREEPSYELLRNSEESSLGTFVLELPISEHLRKPDAIIEKRWIIRHKRLQIHIPANEWRLSAVTNLTQAFEATLFEDASGGQWTDHIPLKRGPNQLQLQWQKKKKKSERDQASSESSSSFLPPTSIWIEAM